MSHASLAARYRPQSFAEVTGQDTVKRILSRAAAEDRVAPAYLLSGTRGVGKTTIARIFAKALNCAQAPTPEPCNQCEACRHITRGNHVDVIEIDGASNRGIDDARRLREASAYAPMEGRYKVFIIDEAHMLTRDAFNALLKTLEEPPPKATFILATTEPHKFPVTILSRCQQFTFTALPEAELAGHLSRILQREGLPFEENAVRLLARRAAGSVRDSMSLLGQTLALGGDALTEASTRHVLGLAGQEFFERLLAALREQDCLAVAALNAELLERGVDLGFFLREFATLWRNLFLIRHAGEAALASLDLPEAEKARLVPLAQSFSLTAIHASWQMVLEGQRQVLTSLEPAAALELLLLNLALLPRLLSMDLLSRALPSDGSGGAGSAAASPTGRIPGREPGSGVGSLAGNVPGSATAAGANPTPDIGPSGVPFAASDAKSAAASRPAPVPVPARNPAPPASPVTPVREAPPWPEESHAPPGQQVQAGRPASPPTRAAQTVPVAETGEGAGDAARSGVGASGSDATPGGGLPGSGLDWESFLAYCETRLSPGGPLALAHLRQVSGVFETDRLVLAVGSDFQRDLFAAPATESALRRLAAAFAGHELSLEITLPAGPRLTEAELKKTYAEHPVIKNLEQTFGASLLRCVADAPLSPQPSKEN